MTQLTTKDYMAKEDKFGAHNYHPIPVVLSKGEGVFVWDVVDNYYLKRSVLLLRGVWTVTT